MAGEYKADPATRSTELTVEDLNRILAAGPKSVRGERALRHLLSRMVATIEAHQLAMRDLHRQVQLMSLESSTKGIPTTLDPASAAQYLPPEFFVERAGDYLQALVEEASRYRDELVSAQRQVTSRVNAIKFAVTTLLEDDSIPDEVTQEFLELVRAMPATDEVPIPENPNTPVPGRGEEHTVAHSHEPPASTQPHSAQPHSAQPHSAQPHSEQPDGVQPGRDQGAGSAGPEGDTEDDGEAPRYWTAAGAQTAQQPPAGQTPHTATPHTATPHTAAPHTAAAPAAGGDSARDGGLDDLFGDDG